MHKKHKNMNIYKKYLHNIHYGCIIMQYRNGKNDFGFKVAFFLNTKYAISNGEMRFYI